MLYSLTFIVYKLKFQSSFLVTPIGFLHGLHLLFTITSVANMAVKKMMDMLNKQPSQSEATTVVTEKLLYHLYLPCTIS